MSDMQWSRLLGKLLRSMTRELNSVAPATRSRRWLDVHPTGDVNMHLKEALGLLSDEAGKILVVIGFFFIVIGFIFLGLLPADQWVFVGCLLLGAPLLTSGLVALLGLPSSGFCSRKNLVVYFLIASSVFAALAFASLFLGRHIVGVRYVPEVGQGTGQRGGVSYGGVWTPQMPAHYIAVVEYPNAWLFVPLLITALCLLGVSILFVLVINRN